MQHIHCPIFAKAIHFRFTFSLFYWKTKPAVLPLQKLQPKLELHTKCLILCSENVGNSIYAESNFWIYGASCFNIHRSGHLEAQTTLILPTLRSYAEVVSIRYLLKTGYSSKKGNNRQTTGMLHVWLWKALPKATPPFSKVGWILPTLSSMQICNNSNGPSEELYRCKIIQNLYPRLFH